jgi:four helix bundle protein
MLRSPAKSFEELIVWQKAHGFTIRIYACTRKFPKDELFGLTAQFRRAAVSVPANIAEGFRKRSSADKARYLNISEGSLDECRYYLILAHDLGYLKKEELWECASEVARLLNGYRTAIVTSGERTATRV